MFLGIKKMAFRVFYSGEQYELPDSMRCLNEYQDDSMKIFDGKWTYILTLSYLEFVDISTEKNRFLRYKLFVGVMPISGNTRIIIYGEYFGNRPYEYGSFHYIEVDESEMIKFDDQPSIFILDVGNNSFAIILNEEVIVICITTDFKKYLEFNEVDEWDECEYCEPYLSIKRIDFIRSITDFPFDRSLIDGSPSFDERMTSRVEKNDGGCKIELCFTCVCRSSETTNEITISFSNEQIRITYAMNTTTYERYMLDGTGYNDFPTIRTDERNVKFDREIRYDLFPEEDD